MDLEWAELRRASFQAARSADLGESLLPIDYVHAIAISCGADSVVNLGKLVAKGDLRRGNVGRLEDAGMPAPARGKQSCREREDNQFS